MFSSSGVPAKAKDGNPDNMALAADDFDLLEEYPQPVLAADSTQEESLTDWVDWPDACEPDNKANCMASVVVQGLVKETVSDLVDQVEKRALAEQQEQQQQRLEVEQKRIVAEQKRIEVSTLPPTIPISKPSLPAAPMPYSSTGRCLGVLQQKYRRDPEIVDDSDAELNTEYEYKQQYQTPVQTLRVGGYALLSQSNSTPASGIYKKNGPAVGRASFFQGCLDALAGILLDSDNESENDAKNQSTEHLASLARLTYNP
jgi:hypothetical protein